jgi:hypothetical protein
MCGNQIKIPAQTPTRNIQVKHFLLTPADLQLVVTCRGDANRYDMALAVEGAGLPRFRPREDGSHSRRGIVDEVASAIKRWSVALINPSNRRRWIL